VVGAAAPVAGTGASPPLPAPASSGRLCPSGPCLVDVHGLYHSLFGWVPSDRLLCLRNCFERVRAWDCIFDSEMISANLYTQLHLL
jgi:hypothetical protein